MVTVQATHHTYLLALLVCKAQLKFPSAVNDYIGVLCSMYKNQGTLPPDMDKDPTPPWQIASAVLSVTNDKDRNAYVDIFNYVYGYTPYALFAVSTS